MGFKAVSQPSSRASSRASSPVKESSPIPPIRKEAPVHRPVPPVPNVADQPLPVDDKNLPEPKMVGIKSLAGRMIELEKSIKTLDARPLCSCRDVEHKMGQQVQIVQKQLESLKFDLRALIDG